MVGLDTPDNESGLYDPDFLFFGAVEEDVDAS